MYIWFKGKSYWILYAICRCLGESKVFLWYFQKNWYLFVRAGVFRCPGDLVVNSFRPYIWAFVDADHSLAGVPPELAERETNILTIFTTSPKRERWMPLVKNMSCVTVIMNPWTWDEIYKA